MELLSLSEGKLIILQSQRDQSLLQEQLSEHNRDLRETRIRSVRDMLRIDESSRRRLIENQDTVNE